MPSLFRQLGLVFGFFTVLPVSGKGSLEDISASGSLLPFIAVTLGALEGLAALSVLYLFGPILSAAMVLAFALLATGFHHADGLADVGDALMARGDRDRRLQVLKDHTMGVGAVGAMLLTYMVSWAALTEVLTVLDSGELLAAMVVVEVCARLCLMLVAMLSEPSHQGSGSAFIRALRGWRGGAGLGISVAVLVLMALYLPLAAILACVGTVIAAFMIIALAASCFGGANGDVLGASVEWGRVAALLGVVTALSL